MELTEALARRRMHRDFRDEPLAPGTLDALLAAALRAPSAGFAQGVDLLVLESAEARRRFWELATEPDWRTGGPHAAGLQRAAALVLPVADPGAYVERYAAADKAASDLHGAPASSWPVPYWIVDASFAVMQLLLAATDAGLGALFFRLHAPASSVLDGMGVPAGRVAIGAVAVGHPTGEDRPTSPATRARRPLESAVHRDRWAP